ncbi:MAG: AsmA family protein [Hyphomicrobiales bacterium]|nr:AsmA family protein [Hyphomicrobiales bacterium]
MKKSRKLGIAVVLIAGLTAAAALPWTYWDDGIRNQLAKRIRDTTGLDLSATGKVTVALLPRPHIKIRSVNIKDRWNTLNIDSEFLKADLRLLSLVTGRFEVSSLSLYLPTIAMNIHGRPLHDRGAIARASAARKSTPQARVADAAQLATINIIGGRMQVRESATVTLTNIGDINATLDWPRIKSQAAFTGEFIWRGEKVAMKAMIAKPGELLRKHASGIKLDINSRLLTLALDGIVTARTGWQYQGKLETASTAFRPLLNVAGAEWPLSANVSNVSVAGQLNVRPGSLSLSSLELQIDGTSFSGAIGVLMKDKRPSVTATLATDSLAVDHRAANLPRLNGPNGRWNKTPLPLRPLAAANLDVRMSAKTASFDNVVAEDVAIVALARNGSIEMSISSPKSYAGAFRASFSLEQGPALPAISGALNFERIDAQSFLASISSRLRLSGQATGEIQFRSAGDNFSDIASLMSGNLKLRLAKGQVSGLDLGQALDLAKTLPLSIPDRIRNGSTALENVYVEATIKDGKLSLTKTDIDSGPIKSALSGSIHLPSRQLNLALTAMRSPPQKSPAETKPTSLELDILGNWNRPSIAPNPESLIMRSKAAEPLLQAPR